MPSLQASSTYIVIPLGERLFSLAVNHFHEQHRLENHLGYRETAKLVSDLCGIKFGISRRRTEIAPGDILLIARLKYRLHDANMKGELLNLELDDLEFAAVAYYACDVLDELQNAAEESLGPNSDLSPVVFLQKVGLI